jgi:hypothetical protein
MRVRKHQCDANGFGIVLINFLMLDEGFDVLRRDHLDPMAKRFEMPLPIEGPCAGFNTNDTRLQFSNLGQQSFAADAALQYSLSVSVCSMLEGVATRSRQSSRLNCGTDGAVTNLLLNL